MKPMLFLMVLLCIISLLHWKSCYGYKSIAFLMQHEMNQLTGVGASDSSDKSKEKAGDQKVSFKTLLC